MYLFEDECYINGKPGHESLMYYPPGNLLMEGEDKWQYSAGYQPLPVTKFLEAAEAMISVIFKSQPKTVEHIESSLLEPLVTLGMTEEVIEKRMTYERLKFARRNNIIIIKKAM
jgi:hypothetical protein